jgi:hypothetical protein
MILVAVDQDNLQMKLSLHPQQDHVKERDQRQKHLNIYRQTLQHFHVMIPQT